MSRVTEDAPGLETPQINEMRNEIHSIQYSPNREIYKLMSTRYCCNFHLSWRRRTHARDDDVNQPCPSIGI